MSIQNGSYRDQTQTEILESLIASAREQFGPDLNDDELSVIRTFYRPVAILLSEIQQDIGLVLESSQVDNASGDSLELLMALIGVSRNYANKAEGVVRFSRESAASVGYTIPAGTIVETDNDEPYKYETAEDVVLEAGETEVFADIIAEVGGVDWNVGTNAITEMERPPNGIESVTNLEQTHGGTETETDDELRERGKQELSEGSSSTAPALVSGLQNLDEVSTASLLVNDTGFDRTDTGGLPDHSFEAVVQGGSPEEIGQYILDNKAAGTQSYSGAFGEPVTTTGTLPNGQEYEIQFSRPKVLQLYVNATFEITDEFDTDGKEEVANSIVDYIGGTLSTGNTTNGDIDVGDNVLINRVQQAILNVRGVYDVSDVQIAFDGVPGSNSEDLEVTDSQVATATAIDNSLQFTTTEI